MSLPNDEVGTALHSACLAALKAGLAAEREGDLPGADQHFDFAFDHGLPLLEVLGESAGYYVRRSRLDRAYICFTLLEQLEPGAIFGFWQEIPSALRARFSPLVFGRMFNATRPRLYELQPIKAILAETLGDVGAAMVVAPMMRPGTNWLVLKRSIASLQDYARAHALEFEELIAPREVVVAAPAVHGGRTLASIRGRTRSVFRCVLEDVVVSGKSNLLLISDCALMDYQGDEISRVEINFDADPIVLAAKGNRLTILDSAEPSRLPQLGRAFTLVGVHTWNYGHWIFEFLFQVWACMDKPGFRDLPLLIDQQMPPQLREALEFFLGASHPIVVMAPGTSVRVGQLWTCSKIAYWPAGERPGSAPAPEAEIADTRALAELVNRLGPRLDAAPPAPPDTARRIYLQRHDTQNRRISNRVEVEAWFKSQGFEIIDLGAISFAQQLARLRAADIVVGPDGAAFYGLLFARPGTRIGMLAQPLLEGYEWWNQMFTELGHRVLLLRGDMHRLNPHYRSQSDFTVNVTELPGFLAELEAEDPPSPGKWQAALGPELQVAPDSGEVARQARETEPGPSEGEVIAPWHLAEWRAYQKLCGDDFMGALAELETAPGAETPIRQELSLVAMGLAARSRGEMGDANEYFEKAFDCGIPLAGLLRHIGRHFKDQSGYECKVYQCYTLLEALERWSIFEYWAGLGASQKRRYSPWVANRFASLPRPSMYEVQPIKAALNEAFGREGAAAVITRMIWPGTSSRVRQLPLRSLQEHARAHGLVYEVLVAPKDVFMSPPLVYGGCDLPGIRGRSRSVFRSVLPDVTVHSKTNLLFAGDCVLMDYQGDELERVPINLDVNPPVAAADGGLVTVLEGDTSGSRLFLEEAFSLMGLHTWNYGHWLFEFMFQVWACMDRPGFRKVPVLIDEQMPTQLREALAFFIGEDHPIVVIRQGGSATVKALWTCSKIAYWPGGEKLPPKPVDDYELSDTQALGQIIRRLAPVLEPLDQAGYPRRIYLTRNAAQGRPIVNRPNVEQFFRDSGFCVLDFNEMPFIEQLKHLRCAHTVVMEAGSTMYGALFCRSGTRIGALTGSWVGEYEWCAQMFKDLGLFMLLFRCETVRAVADLVGSIEKKVNLEQLAAYLDELERGPIAGS